MKRFFDLGASVGLALASLAALAAASPAEAVQMDVAWILCFTLPAALVAAVYLKLREAGCERIALPLALGMFLSTLSVSLILRVALELLPGRGLREPWWYPIPATLSGPAITPLIPFIAEYWVPGLIGPLVHPTLLLIIAALTQLGRDRRSHRALSLIATPYLTSSSSYALILTSEFAWELLTRLTGALEGVVG